MKHIIIIMLIPGLVLDLKADDTPISAFKDNYESDNTNVCIVSNNKIECRLKEIK
jgi:hypothetical protein